MTSIQLVALALTVGTVARVVVGRGAAWVIAVTVLGLALVTWLALAVVDHRRRDGTPLGRAGPWAQDPPPS